MISPFEPAIRRDPALLCDAPIDISEHKANGGLNPYHDSFVPIGQQFAQLLLDRCHLRPYSRVFDIGCGVGRLTQALAACGIKMDYTGYDINKTYIDYCKDRNYPSTFRFIHRDIQHDEYNPHGTIDISSQFPSSLLESKSYSHCCAIALFNHFKLPWVDLYIKHAASLLRPGGYFFCTMFLINTESIQAMARRPRAAMRFSDRNDPDEWHDYINRPLVNAAFSEQKIRQSFISHGFAIEEPIKYGAWVGSPTAVTGHDVIIATKLK